MTKNGILTTTFSHWLTTLPLSEPITDIPEFHDCQRFLVRGQADGGRYDSLYAIFASFRLNNLLSDLDRPPAHLADARLDITGSDNQPHTAMPVATVWTDGGYHPLGIERGFNCLFLFRQATSSGWAAKMIPIGVADTNCLKVSVDPNTRGTALEVKGGRLDPGFTPADYPPTARWDWDSNPRNPQQYIGIKCGPAWCEIGAPGFQPSGPYSGAALPFGSVGSFAPPAVQDRVTAIKGWYDAQELDHVVDRRHVPSGVYGVIVPNPSLDAVAPPNPTTATTIPGAAQARPDLDAYRNTWVHVAYVVLDGDYKSNLKQGVNQIWICLSEKPSGCGVAEDQPPLWPPWRRPLGRCDFDDDADARWWAKIVSADGTERHRCVRRANHGVELNKYAATHQGAVAEIPGTARWRWLLDDAGEWTKCGTACCTGQ